MNQILIVISYVHEQCVSKQNKYAKKNKQTYRSLIETSTHRLYHALYDLFLDEIINDFLCVSNEIPEKYAGN